MNLLARPSPAPAKFETKRDFVAGWLRTRIRRGEFKPGESLTQQFVADAVGVSHTPVREAFRLLEAEGVLTAVSHHGATLPIMTEADIRDLYLIRQNLETMATIMAVERTGTATAAPLRQIQAALETALERDLAAVPEMNRTFHFTLYAGAGSERLLALIDRLWNQCPAYWLKSVPHRVKSQILMHRAIVDAVDAGDARAAGDTIRAHIEEAADSLIALLPELTRAHSG